MTMKSISQTMIHRCLIILVAITACAVQGISGNDVCGDPEDCILSQWNEWSPCSQTCGDSGMMSGLPP